VKANKKRAKVAPRKLKRPTTRREKSRPAKNEVIFTRSKLKKPKARKMSAKLRKRAARGYSMTTIKELFALCSNQCAFPDCTNQIVTAGTRWSRAAVVGHICHIYAASDRGPRGKLGLTEIERNSPPNLILMCGDHHPRVDKQWQTYPAAKLKKWKKAHEAKATKGTAEAIKREADIEKHVFFEEISDDQIEKALSRIRRARYLVGFAVSEEAELLATQVGQSRYSSGSSEMRARALAWCARILSQGKTIRRAEELLRRSREITITAEAALAQAFITAATDKKGALAALALIKTPEALSAALRIVSNKDGAKKALAWISASGLRVDSFDAEGKFTFMMNALGEREWATARRAVDTITERDFVDCPALMHVAAMARLMTAIPDEFREVAFSQVPFEAKSFSLASTPEHIEERRAARTLFKRVSAFAQEVGTVDASNLASDYALWLGLRDPVDHDTAMTELRDSMSDPAISLRRINLANQFGLRVDFAAIEERIDQSIAMSGKGSADEAFARFSLAFTKESPRAAADYIEKHRAQLYEHLHKQSIVGFEIEVLARAGFVTTARERLQEAATAGVSARDQRFLERILAEVAGSDPIAERRAFYESTGELRALVNLIEALERSQLWQEMLPYAERLFAATPSVEAYEQVVRCLNNLERYDDLLASMSANRGLVAQSQYLELSWAWALYREGRFAEAAVALQRLTNRNDANARRLRVNIAIASGAWDELLDFCQETWNDRDQYSAADLMRAAQVSVAVNGPHSRDLVVAATAKEPDDPGILAAAYFQAVNAGWEQSSLVAGWLSRAAQASGDDGPLKAISMQELLEKKPEWDKKSENVWEELKKGRMPTFAAGQLLNRSLLDFYLLPSLRNPSEADTRKRSIVFAYSGARLPAAIPNPATLAIDVAAIITFSRLGLLDRVISRYQIVIPHSTLGWLFQERNKATFHQPSRIRDAAAIKQLIANGALHVARPSASRDHKLTRQVGADLAAMLSAAREKSAAGKKTLVVRSSPLHRLGTVLGEEADITGYEGCVCSCTAVIDRMKVKGALTQAEGQKARNYLRLQERPWANEPTIDHQTDIYLDDLSVSYLQTARVLAKLKEAGLKAFISQSEDNEANSLLALEMYGNQQLDHIEQIRSTLAAGIASGRVRALRTVNAAEDDQLFRSHPTYGALGLVAAADAIVVDDRFINQHPTMTIEKRTSPVLTSLDVLDFLCVSGDISTEELFAHRTLLRQSGYQLVPLVDEELAHHLKNAPVANGELIETAELKAIRQSLIGARMGAIVQLPTETNFLHRTLGAYIRGIKATWEATSDREEAKARANYLLEQVDVRKWAFCATEGNERSFALNAYASYALQITSAPQKADEGLKAAYYEWISERLVKPIKEYHPEVFSWIVARSRELVVGGAEDIAREYEEAR
jgi:hypothetical protein